MSAAGTLYELRGLNYDNKLHNVVQHSVRYKCINL